MDRNLHGRSGHNINREVALRKESVDRNNIEPANLTVSTTSLSARRAWIEILIFHVKFVCFAVALRKESVDRNYSANAVDQILPGSLSARRAWIEICIMGMI